MLHQRAMTSGRAATAAGALVLLGIWLERLVFQSPSGDALLTAGLGALAMVLVAAATWIHALRVEDVAPRGEDEEL